MGQIPIQVIGTLFTVTYHVALGLKSAILDSLVLIVLNNCVFMKFTLAI